MKRKVFPMPNYVRERIKFAMHPIGIEPYNVSEIGYMYRLNYDNGVELHIGAVSAIETRWLGLLRERVVWLAVVEKNADMSTKIHHLSDSLAFPESGHDVIFDMEFIGLFSAMTRAVADALGGGDCLSITQKS